MGFEPPTEPQQGDGIKTPAGERAVRQSAEDETDSFIVNASSETHQSNLKVCPGALSVSDALLRSPHATDGVGAAETDQEDVGGKTSVEFDVFLEEADADRTGTVTIGVVTTAVGTAPTTRWYCDQFFSLNALSLVRDGGSAEPPTAGETGCNCCSRPVTPQQQLGGGQLTPSPASLYGTVSGGGCNPTFPVPYREVGQEVVNHV